MRRTKTLLIGIVLCVAVAAQAGAATTTVILVRHAEKAAPTGDPTLTAAGFERARELARVLADAGVKAIYATQFLRTRQTVEPLAKNSGLQIEIVNAGAAYADDLVARILARHPGQTVVVASHSNTIPGVLHRLGIANPPAIPDTQYDELFVCTIDSAAGPALLRLRYGAPAQ